jgi:hypothetical protein
MNRHTKKELGAIALIVAEDVFLIALAFCFALLVARLS